MSQNYSNKQNGGRFIDLCNTLDIMKIADPELRFKLGQFILNRHFNYKDCRSLNVLKCRLWDGKKDGRVQLPNFIIQWIINNNNHSWRITFDKNNRPSGGSKVTLTWLICYVEEIIPDSNVVNWDYFECSHLCLCAGIGKSVWVCTIPEHLCWESSSSNQSRGYGNCLRLCHCGCGKTLCELYNMHNPPCL